MKIRRGILLVLITIITCFQLILFFKVQNTTTEKSTRVVSLDLKESLLIKDIDKLMMQLKNYKVTSRVRDVDGWIINVKLIGSKDDIIYNLNLLDKFILKSYNIRFENDNYEVELELKSK